MASLSESLNSVKVTSNNRMFKIFGVVFAVACVSAIAYAGTAGSASGAHGRRLQQVCAEDVKQCGGGLGFTVMRVPELNCAFAACPDGSSGAAPVPVAPVGPIEGTTTNKPNVGLIVGGTLAGAAAVGGIVAGAIMINKNMVPAVVPVVVPAVVPAVKPAGAPGNVSQGMLVGFGTLGLFALVFLAVTGAMYVYKKRSNRELLIDAASDEEERMLE
jgi:hypothetical protein